MDLPAADAPLSVTGVEPSDLGIGRLFRNIRDAVIVADSQGRIVLWNPAATNMFGYTREEALGDNVDMIVPAHLKGQHHRGMHRFHTTGHGPYIDSHNILELPAVRKDGTQLRVELTLSPLPDPEGSGDFVLALIRDVTERHEADRERARLAAIVASSDDAIIGLRLDGTITSWNEAASLMYGYDAQEMIGRSVTRLAPPDRREEVPRLLARIAHGGRVQHYETVRSSKAGQLIDVSLTLSPVRDDAGDVVGASVVTRDITDRKRIERQLRASEARFRAFFEQAGVGLAIVGLDGRWQRVNPRLAALLGYSTDEMTSKTFQDVTCEEDRAEDDEARARMADGLLDFYSREKRYLRRDGTLVWVQISVALVRDAAGRPNHFVTVVQDASARKRAEAALRQSETRFRQLAENVHEVFWLTSLDKKRIFYVSPAYERIWGRARDELYDDPVSWMDSVHPADKARIRASAFEVQQTGEYDVEYRIVRPDGAVRWIWDRAFPVRDARGRVYRIAGVAEDVTERVEMTRDLRAQRERLLATNRELSDANEALEAFAYVVSHDLKEPVRAIDAFLRAVQEDFGETMPEEAAGLVQRAKESGQRLSTLLEGLLALSRVSRMDVSQLEGLDVGEALASDACRTRFAHLIEERGACVTVEGHVPRVLATLPGLCQILGNLVVNAIVHNPRPTPRVRVREGAHPVEAGFVDVVVEDNGPGLPADVLGRMDGQVGPGRTTRGGFGLLIAQRAAERLGGRVAFDRASQDLGGAAVHVILPRARP